MAEETTLVEIDEQAELYGGPFLRLSRTRLRFRRSDGQMSEPIMRLAVSHGDAVGVLVYDPQRDAVALVRQFRYPAYAALPEAERQGPGASAAWLLEIVAGIAERGQSAEETARREAGEEIGLGQIGAVEKIATVFTTPGTDTEQITLFVAEADTSGALDGGLAEEGEDTALVRLPLAEALAMVARGQIRDAKTLIALQHLALRLGRPVF